MDEIAIVGAEFIGCSWSIVFGRAGHPVTLYDSNDEEMRRVFPKETIKRLQNLKMKHDPDGMFKAGAWDYQANV